jgi:sulfur carrier protein
VTATVVLNGEQRPLPAATTLAELVADLAPGVTRGIAVAHNGAVVPRSEWRTTAVRAGDRLEVLMAAQGG